MSNKKFCQHFYNDFHFPRYSGKLQLILAYLRGVREPLIKASVTACSPGGGEAALACSIPSPTPQDVSETRRGPSEGQNTVCK